MLYGTKFIEIKPIRYKGHQIIFQHYAVALIQKIKIPPPLPQPAAYSRSNGFSIYSYQKDERVNPGNLLP
jgi:hypothetical protein